MAGRGTDIVLGGRRSYIDELEGHVPVHDASAWNEFKLDILAGRIDDARPRVDAMIGQDRNKAEHVLRSAGEWIGNHNKVVAAEGFISSYRGMNRAE